MLARAIDGAIYEAVNKIQSHQGHLLATMELH